MLEFIECNTAIITLTAIHWDVGPTGKCSTGVQCMESQLSKPVCKIECSIRVASVLLEKLFFHTLQMLYID